KCWSSFNLMQFISQRRVLSGMPQELCAPSVRYHLPLRTISSFRNIFVAYFPFPSIGLMPTCVDITAEQPVLWLRHGPCSDRWKNEALRSWKFGRGASIRRSFNLVQRHFYPIRDPSACIWDGLR